MEEVIEIAEQIQLEQVQNCTVEQIVDSQVSHVKETIGVVKHIPHEQVQSHLGEQIFDESVPRMMEEQVEMWSTL